LGAVIVLSISTVHTHSSAAILRTYSYVLWHHLPAGVNRV
jgi:hypothetical protein